jgi:hypothetical protein
MLRVQAERVTDVLRRRTVVTLRSHQDRKIHVRPRITRVLQKEGAELQFRLDRIARRHGRDRLLVQSLHARRNVPGENGIPVSRADDLGVGSAAGQHECTERNRQETHYGPLDMVLRKAL